MTPPKSEITYGTLDLLALKTLETLGPLHGYSIAERISQVSREALTVNQGTLYPALLRLEHRGWIASEWGVTENNRKARYYRISEHAAWARWRASVPRGFRMSGKMPRAISHYARLEGARPVLERLRG